MLYENGIPKAIDTVVISAQHDPELTQAQVRERVLEHVVQPVLARFDDRVDIHAKHYYVNPTGVFVIGGPQADTGVTGRKIIVDTYGGFCRHGGGAFSGKDPTKVDRSATYMARYLAKNIVAAGLAERGDTGLVCNRRGAARVAAAGDLRHAQGRPRENRQAHPGFV